MTCRLQETHFRLESERTSAVRIKMKFSLNSELNLKYQ